MHDTAHKTHDMSMGSSVRMGEPVQPGQSFGLHDTIDNTYNITYKIVSLRRDLDFKVAGTTVPSVSQRFWKHMSANMVHRSGSSQDTLCQSRSFIPA